MKITKSDAFWPTLAVVTFTGVFGALGLNLIYKGFVVAQAVETLKANQAASKRHAWTVWTDEIGAQQRVSLIQVDDVCFLQIEVYTAPSGQTTTGVSVDTREFPCDPKKVTAEKVK